MTFDVIAPALQATILLGHTLTLGGVMNAFRVLLLAMAGSLLVYTGVVIQGHGWALFPVFFGDMARLAWPGQFNLDFTFMLVLSGLWVAWRHRFSAGGIALGLLAVFGGASFLSVYLLAHSLRVGGDVRRLLVGERLAG
jgi:hypothetical protein